MAVPADNGNSPTPELLFDCSRLIVNGGKAACMKVLGYHKNA